MVPFGVFDDLDWVLRSGYGSYMSNSRHLQGVAAIRNYQGAVHMVTRNKTVADLPVAPGSNPETTSAILEAFNRKRKAIQSVSELYEFVDSWKNMWLLGMSDDPEPTAEEAAIVDKKFDIRKVFSYLMRIFEDDYPYEESFESKIAASIAIPRAVILATLSSAGHKCNGIDYGFVKLFSGESCDSN